MRLAVLTSHPVQYHAPLFRELAKSVDLHVLFAHRASPDEQARAGFGTPFEGDLDLTAGDAPPGRGHEAARLMAAFERWWVPAG